jgi:hypothetical protein
VVQVEHWLWCAISVCIIMIFGQSHPFSMGAIFVIVTSKFNVLCIVVH